MIRILPAVLMLAMGCGPKSPPEPSAAQGDALDPVEAIAEGLKEQVETAVEEEPYHDLVNRAVDLLESDGGDVAAQKAIGILEKAVSRDPRSAVARFNLGVAYHRVGDSEAARRHYEAAVGIDPTVGMAWLHLGFLSADAGMLDAAIGKYRSGIRNDSENMELRVAIIDALRINGRLDEAISEAKSALKVNANNIELYNNMGLAYQELGELVLARFVYQKALAEIVV